MRKTGYLVAGNKVSIDDWVTIQVGNGQRDSTEDIDYIDTPYPAEEGIIENEGGDVDEFKEVQGPINDQ